MAKELSPLAAAAEEEKSKLKEEKKQFRQEQKAQKKEARRRAAEIARQEEALGEEGGNGVITFFATLLIVVLWLAIVGVVIKMDVGGFGSSVLAPILQDVPVINKILPSTAVSRPGNSQDQEGYGGYSSIEEAVAYIRQQELQIESLQTSLNSRDAEIAALKAEVLRLQEFEKKQVEFQRVMTEFYEEVVYSDKGPGLEEFLKWYETMYPATAEAIYKQGLTQQQVNSEIQELSAMYAAMKPKNAAQVLETKTMEGSLDMVVEILKGMSVEDRAAILNQMDTELVAKITKKMYPSS